MPERGSKDDPIRGGNAEHRTPEKEGIERMTDQASQKDSPEEKKAPKRFPLELNGSQRYWLLDAMTRVVQCNTLEKIEQMRELRTIIAQDWHVKKTLDEGIQSRELDEGKVTIRDLEEAKLLLSFDREQLQTLLEVIVIRERALVARPLPLMVMDELHDVKRRVALILVEETTKPDPDSPASTDALVEQAIADAIAEAEKPAIEKRNGHTKPKKIRATA